MSKKNIALETGFLAIDWPEEKETGRAGRVDKFRVDDCSFQIDNLGRIPLNGKTIVGTRLSIDATFMGVESPDLDTGTVAGITIEVHATHKKLSCFGEIGSAVEFADYVRSDEWEVLAILYFYEHLDMLDTKITIIDKTESGTLISIVGRLKYFNENEVKPDNRNPKFYFQHEVEKAKYVV